jgi:hypothetical protein
MARALEVIERSVGSDPSRPCPKAARGIEAGVRAMDAPEGFDGEVFGGSRIANDANDPTVDLALMRAEQRLEGVEVAVTELPQHVGWLFQDWHLVPFYIRLRREGDEGYRNYSPMIRKLHHGPLVPAAAFPPAAKVAV